MLTVLNFCQKDRELALNLLRYIGEIGGAKKHDLILSTGMPCAGLGLHQELELLAQDIFAKVEVKIHDTVDERPWPSAANNAWRDIVFFIRMKVGRPWLWLEPDSVPLSPDWLDRIETQYAIGNRPFMGAEVTTPQHRMSGVAVYPASVGQHTRNLAKIPDKVPWDQYFANDFVPKAHFTNLIQNIWNMKLGDPSTAPVFPDQASLSILDPNAVLFHRCKDFSLAERLRERKGDELCAQNMTKSSKDQTSLTKRDAVAELVSASNAAPSFDPKAAATREAELLAEIAALKAKLEPPEPISDAKIAEIQAKLGPSALVIRSGTGPIPAPRGKQMKPKYVMTPEHKAKLAAARAKKKMTGVV